MRIINTAIAAVEVKPKIKLLDIIGEVNKRSINELLLSFAIGIPEKSEINESPKTAIPGASWFQPEKNSA